MDSMYHVIFLPSQLKRGRRLKGNGGKTGVAGHKPKPLGGDSLLYGNGCLRHNCSDCEQCPMSDCDYSPELEYDLKRNKK